MGDEFDITIDGVHHSIESTLEYIKRLHKDVDPELSDLSYLKRLTTNVLKPLLKKAELPQSTTVDNLRTLLNVCVRKSPTSSPVTTFSDSSSHKSIEKQAQFSAKDVSPFSSLPRRKCIPVPPDSLKPRSRDFRLRRLLPGNVLTPISANAELRNGALPPLPNHEATKVKTPSPPLLVKPHNTYSSRRRRLLNQDDLTTKTTQAENVPDVKRIEMTRLLENVECAMEILQDTFTAFTQRVLVPLQTFCRQDEAARTGKAEAFDKCHKNSDKTSEKTPLSNNGLDRIEFRIVQTLNKIRQLLWTSEGVEPPDDFFSSDGFSLKISLELDCAQFPVIRLVPDLLQKFEDVISLATTWLKCDILMLQNARSCLLRAHRKYLKTEELWQQAKDTQMQLSEELDSVKKSQSMDVSRLLTLQDDVQQIKKELNKVRRIKESLEEKLRISEENLERFRVKHCAARKKIILLSSKLEDKERSYAFIESRVLSLKADQEALTEKIRINENYISNLQTKVDHFYDVRDLLSRRYEEKADPEKLQSKMQQGRLRIPLPELKEKKFDLKVRINDQQIQVEANGGQASANNTNDHKWTRPQCHYYSAAQFKPSALPLPSIPVGRRLSHNNIQTSKGKRLDIILRPTSSCSKSNDGVGPGNDVFVAS